MRVALCFSGLPRFIEQTHVYWKNSILDPYGPDVFVHCWKSGSDHEDKLTETQITNLYQPKLFQHAHVPQFNVASYVERIWPHRITPQNQFSQFTGIKRSQQLRQQWEQQHNFVYDVVIRARFDWYLRHVQLEINHNVNVAHTPTLAGHVFHFHGLGLDLVGINDQFAYGSSKTMTMYGKLVDNIPYLYHHHKIDFCGELFLKAHMEYHRITVKQHVWQNGIVRSTGIMP